MGLLLVTASTRVDGAGAVAPDEPIESACDGVPPVAARAARLKDLIHGVRAQRRLATLRESRRLPVAAGRHARDMVRRQYFSHVTLNGRGLRARVRGSGYLRHATTWWLGEVLAWGVDAGARPGVVLRRWLRSPAHRHVLLSARGRDIGIGAAPGSPLADSGACGAATFVVLIGGRHRSRPAPSGWRDAASRSGA